MHKAAKARKISGKGGKDKTAVLGMIERGGKVRAEVVPDVKRKTIQPRVRESVEPGAAVYTDALNSYSGLEADFAHATVDHAESYVNGRVHTNGIENFWSLLKRGLHGTYVSVEPFHLFRYLDERVFTFNLRDRSDYGRFKAVLSVAVGRRLTFAEVTGKRSAHQRRRGHRVHRSNSRPVDGIHLTQKRRPLAERISLLRSMQ
jgi:transposase-like protein